MAFKVKKLNHTPKWYRDHCTEEDGGSPAFRAMLKADMAYTAADNDSTLTYEEKVGIYEERWNELFSGRDAIRDKNGICSDLSSEMIELAARELAAGFTPSEEFKRGVFKTIDRLMTNHGLSEDHIREFLKWRSRRAAVAKKRQKKERSQQGDSARDSLRRALHSKR